MKNFYFELYLSGLTMTMFDIQYLVLSSTISLQNDDILPIDGKPN